MFVDGGPKGRIVVVFPSVLDGVDEVVLVFRLSDVGGRETLKETRAFGISLSFKPCVASMGGRTSLISISKNPITFKLRFLIPREMLIEPSGASF